MDKPAANTISRLAIVSCVLSAISFAGIATLPFALFAIASILLAAFALIEIHRHNRRGHRLAFGSVSLSVCALIASSVCYVYQYHVESLPNHDRVDFSSIVEESGTSFDKYEGRQICIKGYAITNNPYTPEVVIYMSPNGSRRDIQNIVTIHVPSGWLHSDQAIAVSGILNVNRSATQFETRYTLKAASIRPSKTLFGMSPRAPWEGC